MELNIISTRWQHMKVVLLALALVPAVSPSLTTSGDYLLLARLHQANAWTEVQIQDWHPTNVSRKTALVKAFSNHGIRYDILSWFADTSSPNRQSFISNGFSFESFLCYGSIMCQTQSIGHNWKLVCILAQSISNIHF